MCYIEKELCLSDMSVRKSLNRLSFVRVQVCVLVCTQHCGKIMSGSKSECMSI